MPIVVCQSLWACPLWLKKNKQDYSIKRPTCSYGHTHPGFQLMGRMPRFLPCFSLLLGIFTGFSHQEIKTRKTWLFCPVCLQRSPVSFDPAEKSCFIWIPQENRVGQGIILRLVINMFLLRRVWGLQRWLGRRSTCMKTSIWITRTLVKAGWVWWASWDPSAP